MLYQVEEYTFCYLSKTINWWTMIKSLKSLKYISNFSFLLFLFWSSRSHSVGLIRIDRSVLAQKNLYFMAHKCNHIQCILYILRVWTTVIMLFQKFYINIYAYFQPILLTTRSLRAGIKPNLHWICASYSRIGEKWTILWKSYDIVKWMADNWCYHCSAQCQTEELNGW